MVARVLLAVLLLLAGAAHAQFALESGDVLVHSYAPQFCTCPTGAAFAVYDSTGALRATSNLNARGVLAPSPELLVMSQQWNVDVNNTKMLFGRGFDHLGEIVQTRAENYLVVETFSPSRPAVVHFSRFGEMLDVTRMPAFTRAEHIELLSDQCTLLHTTGWDADASESRRVQRFNVCTGRAEEDLFRVPEDAMFAGAIRELPGGELLIATGMDVRRFDADGNQLETYPVPATHIALTPDAKGFWAGWSRTLQRVDFDLPRYIAVTVGLPENHTGAFAVVGEWRSAVRTPATPRRRRVR